MIFIAPGVHLDERDLHFAFVRAAGPGGQNVNKVASAVQLRYDVLHAALPAGVKARLTALAGRRVAADGTILIEARRFRTQAQNREDALNRLMDLVRRATKKPKSRKKSKPTAASKEKRLEQKKRRGEIKRKRRTSSYDL